MPPTLSRRQAVENAAFLRALRQTGNATLAAREIGMHRTTFIKRRRKHAGFAAEWEAALACAQAALRLGGGPRPPEILPGTGRGTSRRLVEGATGSDKLRTKGGEITVARGKNGKLQLRRALPGRMTKDAEQAFFRALAASANVRLAAAATGFNWRSFYVRKYASVAFNAEMRRAIAIGHDRLECAAIEQACQSLRGAGEDSAWLDHAAEDNPVPPMTFDQVLQLLYYHRATVRLGADCRDRRPRKPVEMKTVYDTLSRNIDATKRAAHYEKTGDWRFPHEQLPPDLPPLHLVTGWSQADPAKKKHNPKLALFGGWRIEQLRKKQGKR